MASALLYDRSIGAKRIVRNLQGERSVRCCRRLSVARANERTIRRKERP